MAPTSSGADAIGDPADRLRRTWQLRPLSDYVFSFPTALGWAVLTCGAYWFYVIFQLVRRVREHNLRRHEFLESAASLLWQRAQTLGRAEDLRPDFEHVGAGLARLRRVASEFRDPVIWLLLSMLTGGLAGLVAYVLLDRDLVAHEKAESDVESALTALMDELGVGSRPGPVSGTVKRKHRYAARLVVLVATLGVYGLWWTRDLMNDGNSHFRENWRFEDELVGRVRPPAPGEQDSAGA